MIALPGKYEPDVYTTATTASNCPDDTWIDCSATWGQITVTIPGPPVPQKQANKPNPTRLRPPTPRRSSRPPAARLDFARRPVNRHPSARRAFRY